MGCTDLKAMSNTEDYSTEVRADIGLLREAASVCSNLNECLPQGELGKLKKNRVENGLKIRVRDLAWIGASGS